MKAFKVKSNAVFDEDMNHTISLGLIKPVEALWDQITSGTSVARQSACNLART